MRTLTLISTDVYVSYSCLGFEAGYSCLGHFTLAQDRINSSSACSPIKLYKIANFDLRMWFTAPIFWLKYTALLYSLFYQFSFSFTSVLEDSRCRDDN